MAKISGLKKTKDFLNGYEKGRCYYNRNIVLYVIENDLDCTRIGFSISKKIGNSVHRNKIRRRIKSIIHENSQIIEEGMDVIIISKKKSKDLEFAELKSSIMHVFRISGLIKESD